MRKTNIIIPLAVLAVLGLVGYRVLAATDASTSTGVAGSVAPSQIPLHATISDLQTVGFTNVQVATPVGARFIGPTDYFTVADTVDPKNSEAPNVVMVDSSYYPYADKLPDTALYVHGTDNHPFDISGGKGQEATAGDGRIAVSFVKGNNYTVVIGPNKLKIEALALGIANEVK